MALQGQAFRPAFVRGLGREGANFLAISSLQRDVPVLRLSLPSGINAMEAALRRSLFLGSDGSGVLSSAEKLTH